MGIRRMNLEQLGAEIRALFSFWDPQLSEASYLPGAQSCLNSDKSIWS